MNLKTSTSSTAKASSTKKSSEPSHPSSSQASTNNEKPLIAFANVEKETAAKFSGRTTEAAIRKGVNLGEVMRLASEAHGGKGGGHNIAAGAQVPLDEINGFIKDVNELVGKQLKGEKIGSDNKP